MAYYTKFPMLLRGNGVGINPEIPFIYDANTHWWNFISSSNVIETTGDDTVSYVKEQIGNTAYLTQELKDDQPLIVANGVNFNTVTTRFLQGVGYSNFLKNKNGFFVGGVARWDTVSGGVILIDATQDVTVYLTGARNLGLKVNGSFVIYSSPLTLGQWYSFGIYFSTDTDTAKIYINGIEVVPAFVSTGPWSSFPDSVATNVKVGTDQGSLDGALKHIIFQNGSPSPALLASFNSYLLSEKP